MDSGAEQAQVYTSYGKACLLCVKSKTRCVSSPSGGKCQRCQRVNKDCEPAPTVRRKRVSKRTMASTSTSTRTAALEEKLDGIVQLLQRSQGAIPATSQSQDQVLNQNFNSGTYPIQNLASNSAGDGAQITHGDGAAQSSVGRTENFATGNIPLAASGNLNGISQQNDPNGYSAADQHLPLCGHPTPASSSTENQSLEDMRDPLTNYPLETEAELEEVLETYRREMVPYFPIVCIGEGMTMCELRTQRPFLFLVIRTVASKNLRRQVALVLQVKKTLGTEILVEGMRNMDLFLGILVFAAWCHFYFTTKPIITTIVQLAISLAFELGLMRPRQTDNPDIMKQYICHEYPRLVTTVNTPRTMEHRRAVVGLYLMTSTAANYFQRNEHMRWTPYLDECLRLLDEKEDFPTDKLLVHLVRIQLICNQASSSSWNDMFGDVATRAPKYFHAKTLKAQLDDLTHSIPQELKCNSILQLHIHATTLTIHEYSLNVAAESKSSDPASQMHRIESLWTCFTSVKSWFNLFFDLDAFPITSYPHISMAIVTQMTHCIIALYRLSTFEAPGIFWDRKIIVQELSFAYVARLMAERRKQVPLASGLEIDACFDGDKDGSLCSLNPWSQSRRKAVGIAHWWEAKVAAIMGTDAEGESSVDTERNGAANGTGVPGQHPVEPFEFEGLNMDMLDDSWIMDLMGGGLYP